MRRFLVVSAAALALGGCALFPQANDPARRQHNVSLINSLSWDNPLAGKRDGLRSAWPLATLGHHTEYFPLAQVRQCDQAGACSWGVLNASRTIGQPEYLPNGVKLDLALTIDVDRRQQVKRNELDTAMAIPADVPALSLKRTLKQTVTLEYGKVQRVALDLGVAYDLCVERLDAARKSVDKCDVPFF